MLQYSPNHTRLRRRPVPTASQPSPTQAGGRLAAAQNNLLATLLAALPEGVALRLRAHLRQVQCSVGSVLFEPGMPIDELYFPQSAVVALSVAMADGSSAEVALVGREGVVGVRLLLGQTSLNVRARVQSGGSLVKLPVHILTGEMTHNAALLQLLLRYTGSYIENVVQTAACNRHGTVEQRVCRWLLMNLDRLPSNELTMTHESIAVALGVKREGVTEAAGRLRRQGAIDYRRGRIRVLDRPALERQAHEFYGTHGSERLARFALGH